MASLEQELYITHIEIRQLQLDLMRSRALAMTYGWRENLNQRVTTWRSSLRSVFTRISNSFRSFVTSLTTRQGERLPSWVYSAFSGALDDILKYLEKQMEVQDDHFRATLLEILRNTVRIYRNKIRNSSGSGGSGATLQSGSGSNSTSTDSPGSNATKPSTETPSETAAGNEVSAESESNTAEKSPGETSTMSKGSEHLEEYYDGKENTAKNSWTELEENWDRDLHDEPFNEQDV